MKQQRPLRPVLPKVTTPQRGAINARAIRLRTPGDIGLTQQSFANAIGVPVRTLRNWEQQRRQPTGPARVLLSLSKVGARNAWAASGEGIEVEIARQEGAAAGLGGGVTMLLAHKIALDPNAAKRT